MVLKHNLRIGQGKRLKNMGEQVFLIKRHTKRAAKLKGESCGSNFILSNKEL